MLTKEAPDAVAAAFPVLVGTGAMRRSLLAASGADTAAIQPELVGFLWVDRRATDAFDEATDVQLLVWCSRTSTSPE